MENGASGDFMQSDIYENEQRILDEAKVRIADYKNGGVFDFEEHEAIVKEYAKVLRQLRLSTKISDRTSGNLHENNVELTDKVHFDALTGIYNRRFMEESMKRIMKSLLRSSGTLSVLMLDVDFFKEYNDTYGHAAGDVCLKAIAEAVTDSLFRPDDFVARYGGEEFIVVLPNTDESGTVHVANKILANVYQANIPHEKSDVAPCVTVSIGVAAGVVEQARSIDDYVKCADSALYAAKNSGRNRYTYKNFSEREYRNDKNRVFI